MKKTQFKSRRNHADTTGNRGHGITAVWDREASNPGPPTTSEAPASTTVRHVHSAYATLPAHEGDGRD
jgi:hypothetical protein